MFSQNTFKILDAGCGTGGLISVLSRTGYDLEGFDYSDDALHFCHERGLNNVFKADINEWTPKPNSYDLITSMDVLYHEWIQDEVKVLQNLADGLKENGLLMANYPAFKILGRKHDKVVMTRERYTKKDLKKIFAEAGMIPIILSYRLPHAFLFLLLLRFFETRTENNDEEKSDVANIPSNLVNHFLILIGKLENRLIAWGISLPFGSSLFVVAKKIV
jgi:SAM-dependent methyltransferase